MIGATFCSGIGAPEMAAPWVDWRFASEIEAFPRAVLAQRFGYRDPAEQNQGESLLWGDMQTVTPDLWRDHGIPLPELVVAGTPCQAFSVAGLRRGLDDDRGNLTLKFVEICHAIVDARPDGRLTVLWENVPGVLSDKSNAFGCFLGALVGAEQPIVVAGSWPSAGMVGGPRARAAWIVRDAQYFGVAQRRRRVFVVIDFGNRVDPAKVLFERKGVQGHFAPRREAGQDVAGTLDASVGGASEKDWQSAKIVCSHDPAATLETTCNDYSRADGFNMIAFDCKGSEVQHDTVAPPMRAMGRAGSHVNGGGHAAVAIAENQRGALRLSDTVPALSRGGGKPGQGYAAVAIQERAVSENPDAGPGGKGVRDDDTAFTLEARHHVQAVAFKPSHCTRGKDGAPTDVVPPLSADADKGDQDAVVWSIMPQNSNKDYKARAVDVAQPLMAGGPVGGNQGGDFVQSGPVVRRLTPVECARLQGFPDDHCAISYRGKPAADGPQYKAYGNSMAVPVIAWILDRIRADAEGRL